VFHFPKIEREYLFEKKIYYLLFHILLISALLLFFLFPILSCSARDSGSIYLSFTIEGIPSYEREKLKSDSDSVRKERIDNSNMVEMIDFFRVNPEYMGKKFFARFPREIKFDFSEEKIIIPFITNFPGAVSLVVARGIFGGVKIIPMTCKKKEMEERKGKSKKNDGEKGKGGVEEGEGNRKNGKDTEIICISELDRNTLMEMSSDGNDIVLFWFMLKVGENSFYVVPNAVIIQQSNKTIYDFIGKIIFERR